MNTIALNENCRKLAYFTRTNSKANRSIAVKRHGFSVGEILTGQLSLKPLATGIKARDLLCYFANRELGMSTAELYHRLRSDHPTASCSVQRGELISEFRDLHSAPMKA